MLLLQPADADSQCFGSMLAAMDLLTGLSAVALHVKSRLPLCSGFVLDPAVWVMVLCTCVQKM
jgi:hypothetical protein